MRDEGRPRAETPVPRLDIRNGWPRDIEQEPSIGVDAERNVGDGEALACQIRPVGKRRLQRIESRGELLCVMGELAGRQIRAQDWVDMLAHGAELIVHPA